MSITEPSLRVWADPLSKSPYRAKHYNNLAQTFTSRRLIFCPEKTIACNLRFKSIICFFSLVVYTHIRLELIYCDTQLPLYRHGNELPKQIKPNTVHNTQTGNSYFTRKSHQAFSRMNKSHKFIQTLFLRRQQQPKFEAYPKSIIVNIKTEPSLTTSCNLVITLLILFNTLQYSDYQNFPLWSTPNTNLILWQQV